MKTGNLLGDVNDPSSEEIIFSLAPGGGGGGPSARAASGGDPSSRIPDSEHAQQVYSPPGTMKSLNTEDLRQWALEVAEARGIPMPNTGSTRSWTRRQRDRDEPPTWTLPFSRDMTQSYTALKKPTGLMRVFKAPYTRTLVVRCNERGPCELVTVDPGTGRETNKWDLIMLLDVVTQESSVFLSLPGSTWRSATLLELQTESPQAATALAYDWGWVLEDEAQSGDSPPVHTTGGETFTFRH